MTTPKPPTWWRAPARRFWAKVWEAHEPEDHEAEILRLACEQLDRAHQARMALKSHGLTTVNRFGDRVAAPEVKIERDATLAFSRLVAQLGFQPEEEAPALSNVRPLRRAS
jgi:P27 family predicted phage terminase small subunit